MNKYAFLVGVGEYNRPAISSVRFAARDAEAIGGILRERCGFQTTVLLNPIAGEFAGSLGDMVSVIDDPDDLFCFFFAGHGVEYGNESYLLLKDAYPEDRLGMYQLSALRDKFARLRCKNRLVFLDCCRNDPRSGRGDAANLMGGRLSAALNGLGARDIGLAAADAGGERLTLLLKACSQGERAYEWDVRQHGAFSWFLKEGLEGAAWRDGALSAHELCNYVAGKVRDWAGRQKLSQQPDFQQYGAAGDIVLAGEAKRGAVGASGAATEPVVVVSAPPETFECPICGQQNFLANTFRCKGCGRDKLCKAHQDAASFLCAECEGERRKPELRPERSGKGMVLGLLFLVLACGAGLVFWDMHKKQEVKETVERPPEVEKPSQVVEHPTPPEVAKPSQVVEQPTPPEVAKPSQVVEQAAPPEVEKPSQVVEHPTPSEVAKPSQVVEQAAPSEVAKPSQVVEQPVARPVGKTWTNSLGMEFALIPAGTFQMGCTSANEECDDDENPRHSVRISRPFYLGKTEVTQAQWEAIMGSNPSRFKGANRPVENVSWNAIQEFIKRLNAKEKGLVYRLPTEAEWEYAARAGSRTAYSFGDEASRLGDYAWYRDNSGWMTHPVGEKEPNAWGLHDMHGNVWEWVQDWYGGYSAGAVEDPTGPQAGESRVLRGGGWNYDARYCRAAHRGGLTPGSRYEFYGFRLALSPGH